MHLPHDPDVSLQGHRGAEGGSPHRFRAFQAQVERKPQMRESAHAVEDLCSPLGNRLEKLSGKRAEQ